MPSAVADPQVAASLDAVDTAIEGLRNVEVDLTSIEEANAFARELEKVTRKTQALQVQYVNSLHRTGIYRADGHASAKVMVRHTANLSATDANRREAMAKVLRSMPMVAAAFADGALGTSQVERIARTYANPRVRAAFIGQDANVAVLAHRLPYVKFDEKLTDWERLTDEDGADQKARRDHQNRKHHIHTDYDGNHHIDGFHTGLQGAEMKATHDRYCQLEFEKDWAEARERLGDNATVNDLHRTDAQRTADAAAAAWRAANHAQATEGGSLVTVNVTIDNNTLDREVDKACGGHPGPDPRADTLLTNAIDDLDLDLEDDPDAPADEHGHEEGAGSADPDARPDEPLPASRSNSRSQAGEHSTFRCHTDGGVPLHPSEALAAALTGHIRRVITGADGVVLDMGRLRRLFTGPQRDAVMLSADRCTWIGCLVPTPDCQADHLDAFNGPQRGRTNPGNGGPLCGRHNRLKERGFHLYRDERGRIHILRPDGTEIL